MATNSYGGFVNDEAHAGRRAGLAKVGAGFAIMLAVCAVAGYLAWPVLAEPVYVGRSFLNRGCFAAPDEPAKLAGEAVFQQLPAGAAQVGQPATLQPCTETGPGSESQAYGAVTVEYRSVLSDAEIRGAYEVVARESGWRLVSDPSGRRLVFAMKLVRDRCLWLSVFGPQAVGQVPIRPATTASRSPSGPNTTTTSAISSSKTVPLLGRSRLAPA